MSIPPEYIAQMLGMQQNPNTGVGLQPSAPVQPPVQAPVQRPTPAPQQTFDFQDPLFRMALLSAGLQALQPVQPGQSQLGHVASALQGGIGTLNTLQEQRRKGGLEERQVSTGERKVDVAERGLEQTGQQFDKTYDLQLDQLGVDKNYKEALARYYDRLGRAALTKGGEGGLKNEDLIETARKMADTEWNALVNSGIPQEELLKRYPGGIGALTQRYIMNLRQALANPQEPDMLQLKQDYMQTYGINPDTGLPLPQQGQQQTPTSQTLPSDPVQRAQMEIQQQQAETAQAEMEAKTQRDVFAKRRELKNVLGQSGVLIGQGDASQAAQAVKLAKEILAVDPQDTSTYNQLRALLRRYPDLGNENG